MSGEEDVQLAGLALEEQADIADGGLHHLDEPLMSIVDDLE
jgi:hypothetical protein